MKFRSKFTLGFTNRGCLHCAILEAYKATDMQFFLRNVYHKGFRDFEIQHESHQSSLKYCWSLLWCNYDITFYPLWLIFNK